MPVVKNVISFSMNTGSTSHIHKILKCESHRNYVTCPTTNRQQEAEVHKKVQVCYPLLFLTDVSHESTGHNVS